MDTVVSIASHRDPQEKEANPFASELLMPKSDVEEFIKTYGARLRDPASLQTVARHFNVSRDAIFYRLTQLGVFSWAEKSNYFSGSFTLQPPPPVRVANIDAQVDGRFRDLAISLHQAGEISTGKLAEWLFTPRHVVEEYLADLARAKVMGISDGANHEGEHAGTA